MRSTSVIGAALAGMTFASSAAAVEREHHLGLDAGMSLLAMSDRTDVGAAVGAHWAYGLNDAFNLMAEGGWSLEALGDNASSQAPRTRPANIAHAGMGAGYVFDVLRWVPYAGLLVGGYALWGGNLERAKISPGVALAAGLDYRLSRSWAMGFAFRQHLLLTEMSTYPSFNEFLARFEYTWGW